MKYTKEVNLIVKELDERKAEEIKVVDVKENTPFCDYYVIATCPNEKALGAIAEDVAEVLEANKIEVRKVEGLPESHWLIVDAGSAVVQLFTSEKRQEIALDVLLEKTNQKAKR
jgi:ribosome-associated protein